MEIDPIVVTKLEKPATLAFREQLEMFYTSGSQPLLMHSSLGSFWNFSFIPYCTISAGWLKWFKRHFCDDTDRMLWVEI